MRFTPCFFAAKSTFMVPCRLTSWSPAGAPPNRHRHDGRLVENHIAAAHGMLQPIEIAYVGLDDLELLSLV